MPAYGVLSQHRLLTKVVGDCGRTLLLTMPVLFVALLAAGAAQDRSDLEAHQRCLNSLINWEAVSAMLTAPNVTTLEGIYQKVWEHSNATEATYALSRYRLQPDARSLELILACVPRNRLDTWLLDQLLYGAEAHAREESLRTTMAHVPDDYYSTLAEVVAKRRTGYKEYLRLGAILEGDAGELVAANAVGLWEADRKGFDDALAGLDRTTRRQSCVIFGVEPEPWLKDKRIQQLCPDQKPALGE